MKTKDNKDKGGLKASKQNEEANMPAGPSGDIKFNLEEEKEVTNYMLHFERYLWAHPRARLTHLNQFRQQAVARNLRRYDTGQVVFKFQRRITALTWHPKRAYLAAAACKGGDVVLARRCLSDSVQRDFETQQIIAGCGAGGAIFSVKFNPEDPNILYTASLDGKVVKYDIENIGRNCSVFYDFENWNLWHTAMDVSTVGGVLMACDNRGYARLFDMRTGNPAAALKLHKSKIHHCEFNPTVPHIIATAALDPGAGVGIWDLRKLGSEKHEAIKLIGDVTSANVSTFNPSGTRLLVNDQKDVIKAYEGPLWDEYLSLKHPHRQFQHLTGIEASWHPLDDMIVIGRYPIDPPKAKPASPRPVDIYDGKKGSLLVSLYHPLNGIISLNLFNPNGEVLASGMGVNLILWQASHHLEMIGGGKSAKTVQGEKISAAQQSAVRGQQRRRRRTKNRNGDNVGSDDDESSDEDEIDRTKKKQRKTAERASAASSKKKTNSEGGAEENGNKRGRRR